MILPLSGQTSQEDIKVKILNHANSPSWEKKIKYSQFTFDTLNFRL